VSRGIPIERFQVVAKGGTDPAVPTPPGVGEERNRCVELTWR
jgi:outer membrane protein OmpA-like peptidoglycan-associated protein